MNLPALRDLAPTVSASILSSALTGYLVKRYTGIPIDWHLTADFLGHLATLLGVLGAGLWALYLIQRRSSLVPRAEVSHKYWVWEDAIGKVLRVETVLSNPSEVVLWPGDGMTYVQTPPIQPIEANDYATETWEYLAKIRHAVAAEQLHIDPKESETYTHDVRLPAGQRYVQLYTWIFCERDPSHRPADGSHPTEPVPDDEEKDKWTCVKLIDLEAPVAESSPGKTSRRS